MKALTVDDEPIMLNALTSAVKLSPDISSVSQFTSCTAALKWAENHPIDIAFLDISMRGMGGLALAEKLIEIHPDCKIIFCTGFSEYAVEAFKIHVSGYLLKPITAKAVQAEINHIKGKKAKEKLITVKCFGNFEVMSNNEILKFRRSKSKELLAVMIDRKGAGMTSKQICAIMWTDNGNDDKHMNYMRQLFIDLRNTLKSIGAEAALVQNGYNYSLDTERIDCDYYSYLQIGKPEFQGEYMSQYDWAETTCAYLLHKLYIL
ncbi:MAG: response regulator [Clostridia bacterium]|nr:response regulator [Clostridia bacterium]